MSGGDWGVNFVFCITSSSRGTRQSVARLRQLTQCTLREYYVGHQYIQDYRSNELSKLQQRKAFVLTVDSEISLSPNSFSVIIYVQFPSAKYNLLHCTLTTQVRLAIKRCDIFINGTNHVDRI
jgi:hypothetical protein